MRNRRGFGTDSLSYLHDSGYATTVGRLKISPEHAAQVCERRTEDGDQITSFWRYILSLGDKGSGCITDERPNRSRVIHIQRAPPILRISEVSVLRNVSVRCWTELLSPQVQEWYPQHTHTSPILHLSLLLWHFSSSLLIFTPTLSSPIELLQAPAHPYTSAHIHTHTHAQNRALIIDTFPSTLSKNSLISFASWCPHKNLKNRGKKSENTDSCIDQWVHRCKPKYKHDCFFFFNPWSMTELKWQLFIQCSLNPT